MHGQKNIKISNLAFYHLYVEALNCRFNYDCLLQIFTKHTYYCNNTLHNIIRCLILYIIERQHTISTFVNKIPGAKIHISLVRIN